MQADMTPKSVEVALSVAMAEWFMDQFPNTDIDTTPLSELGGEDEAGILLTVNDDEFKITVEQIR